MIALTVLSETAKTLTVGWTPIEGSRGYAFYVDWKLLSNTWDATRSSIKFAKPDAGVHTYEVVALTLLDQGSLKWPAVTPPPPPPPSGFAALPVGPFVKHGSEVSYGTADPQTVSGLDIGNFKGAVNGLSIMQWPPKKSSGPWTVRDIVTQNIGNVPPTSDGTREAGIWFGQQVNAERLVCDGSWEGLWTGAMCCDSVIKDFTVGKADGKGGYSLPAGAVAGLYCEHFTRRVTFKNFDIHSIGPNGIISEWWYADGTYAPFVHSEYPDALAGKAGSCHNTYQDGRVYCPKGGKGIFLDAGTFGDLIQRVTFWGPGDAVWMPNHLADPSAPNILDQASCVFEQDGKNLVMHNNAIG